MTKPGVQNVLHKRRDAYLEYSDSDSAIAPISDKDYFRTNT